MPARAQAPASGPSRLNSPVSLDLAIVYEEEKAYTAQGEGHDLFLAPVSLEGNEL